MNHPKGFKVTVLPEGRRGRNNRKLALHRRTKYTKKPKGYVLSDVPRSL